MNAMHYDILIVGSGQAGAQAAVSLRQQKFTGSIGLLGEEPELPYERPPLSKDYLSGAKEFDRLLIRSASFWTMRDIALLPGRRVEGVDPAAHEARLEDGGVVTYGKLIWAAGGRARRLTCPGSDLAGIHVLRNRADADALAAALQNTNDVVVVGGGYIGLEAAAVLTKQGKCVTLLEALPRVLARVAGEELSRFFEAEHRAQGVELRLSTQLAALEGQDGRVCGAQLADGSVLPCGVVIAGIGLEPSTEILAAAGVVCGNGVQVDAFCRTSSPDIFAIGDCALHENSFAEGRMIRLESVQNATDMADAVAKTICGQPTEYAALPWFWSSQYDLKLQMVGISTGHDEVILRGNLAARSFSLVYLRQGRVIALDCVNAVKDFAQGRALVKAGATMPAASLVDTALPLAVPA